jgi:hypothetical protein
MRKILFFELSMALKDRPKSFQFITLLLLSFSLAVVLFNSLAQVAGDDKAREASRQKSEQNYTGMLPTRNAPLLHLKK